MRKSPKEALRGQHNNGKQGGTLYRKTYSRGFKNDRQEEENHLRGHIPL